MTLPTPRKAVQDLPRYVPGARGEGGIPPVKLSSNENPHAPLPSVVEAIARAGDSVHRYPDMFSRDLTERLAERHGLSEREVTVAAGSVSVLGHLLQAFAGDGDEVLYAWRSFEAYPILARLTGALPVTVPLLSDGRHDLDGMARAVTSRTKVVVLCSPNNPTGPALGQDGVARFLESVPTSVLVVLDEAYVEFIRDPEAVDGTRLLADHPNLVVTRTFSKAYGLAGLRVGYALGQAEVVSLIQACVTPFSVSGVAQAAALASLDAEAELLDRVEAIVRERERVVALLRADGWTVPDTEGNFFWIPAGDRASALASHLGAGDPPLLARPFSGDGVRVTVGLPEENDLLLSRLGDFPTRF